MYSKTVVNWIAKRYEFDTLMAVKNGFSLF